MKNSWTILLAAALLPVACQSGGPDPDVPETFPPVEHGLIVLGERLEDPYTVDNVNRALRSLYPTRAERVDVTPTDFYVRFLPENDDDYERLTALGVQMTDHPLDYRIVREGDYYHDPSLDDEDITWQYAVVPHDFVFPEDIPYELIDRCYISEHDRGATRSADGIDWAAVERESYRLTGNCALLAPETRAESVNPSGRITVIDPNANGGKPFGVAGVKVTCNSFVKIASAYCDRDGYYQMPTAFSAPPRYRLVFKNEKGFGIGLNLILVPASVSTLGKGEVDGMNVTVSSSSDGALFRRCVVNNAAYEYFERCGENDMDIKAPSQDLRFWIFNALGASSTLMLHHGAVVDDEQIAKYLGKLQTVVRLFLPDITLGTREEKDYCDIYLSVVHEMSHASHFSVVGKTYWNHFIDYIITSYIASGGSQVYGDGTMPYAGYCEIGEMWAYYNESKMFKERYGGTLPTFGTSFWFRPQIFRYLDERGLGRSQLFKALTADVISRETLLQKLIKLYPERQEMIEQIFERYAQ